MNADNAVRGKSEGRLSKRFGWLLEEWVAQLLLVVAVVAVVVDGFVSVDSGSWIV